MDSLMTEEMVEIVLRMAIIGIGGTVILDLRASPEMHGTHQTSRG
jgi:hypothetical protein